MALPSLYPVRIPAKEREIIIRILSDRMYDMPALWKKITDKNNEMYITSHENGFMIGMLSEQRNTVPECWKQLIDVYNKIRKEAGVEETDLENNMVQLTDRSGFVIVRQKHDWE